MTVCFFKEQSRAVARSAGMGVGKSFSRGGSGFFQGFPKILPGGDKSGEIAFYALETKKTTFFAENLIGKCQYSKFKEGQGSPFRRPCMHAETFAVALTRGAPPVSV